MFSIQQLATMTGRQPATIRTHHRSGWLKMRTYPGVAGLRATEAAAKAWLSKFFPWVTITQTPAPAPAVVEPGAWMQSAYHDSAHFVTGRVTACAGTPTSAKVPDWVQWHPSPDLRRCRRCMHAH